MAEETTVFDDEESDALDVPESPTAETEDTPDDASASDETPDEGAGDTDAFTDDPEPEDEAGRKVYKHFQAAFTKARMRDREQHSKLADEHTTYKQLLANFYADDSYALQVIRQRFPHLADRLSGTDNRATLPASAGQGTVSSGAAGQLQTVLQQKLGPDLAFLAPALADAMQAAVGAALQPLEQRTQAEQAQARRQQEDAIMADLDGKYPGWEERYGADMQALHDFLGSDQLTHPKFGNRYELLFRVLNKDTGRIEAARAMEQAGRRRLSAGRTGRSGTPNITDQVTKAARSSEAFRLAAQAALEELGL